MVSFSMEDWTSYLYSPSFLYFLFFVHGIAQSFGSNVVSNSLSFFSERLKGSSHGFVVIDYIFVILTTVRLVSLFLTSYFVRKVVTDRQTASMHT
jgi:hypothetical protein